MSADFGQIARLHHEEPSAIAGGSAPPAGEDAWLLRRVSTRLGAGMSGNPAGKKPGTLKEKPYRDALRCPLL
jgi:hypothetical protein